MIYQVLPTLSYGDAVGNHALALARLLRRRGYDNAIFAENIHPQFTLFCQPFSEAIKVIRPFDVVIYHLSTGTEMSYWFKNLDCRKVLIYHNVTPPEYFEKYNDTIAELTRNGRAALRDLAGTPTLSIADSRFNANELLEMGYDNVSVVPILIPFDDYRQTPDAGVLSRMKDGKVNLLFTGRISPNKRQEDVIAVYNEYRKIWPASRLILVGSDSGLENYGEQLRRYSAAFGMNSDDCVFTGHIPFPQILAYYQSADAFVCMSEHEGFCVPLVESMFFRVPIFARACGAIPGTLGHSGVQFKERDFAAIASSIHTLLTRPFEREMVLKEQDKQLLQFDNDRVGEQFMRCIEPYLD